MSAPLQPHDIFAVRLFWAELGGGITLGSYLVGSIPFGFLAGKTRGIDIREHGSGNIGATNVTRVLGKKLGYTVFACDALKGLIVVVIAKMLSHHALAFSQTHTVGHSIYHRTDVIVLPEAVAAIIAAISCIIGHNFPVWLRFKGGKGMATSAGVLIGMMPWTAAACLLVWTIVFGTTRYVSLASIFAAITLPLVTMLFLVIGVLHGWPYFYFALAACILAVWRHRSNIVRLMNGTESRFAKKLKPEQA